MSNGRTRRHARIAGVVVLALIAILLPRTGQADPKPTLDQVRAQVDALQTQAEIAAERYNDARDKLGAARRALSTADKSVARQQAKYVSTTRSMGGYAAELYRQGGLDPSVQALLASSPEDFLAGTALAQTYTAQQVAALRAVARERAVLEERKADASVELQRTTALESAVETQKQAIDDKVAESKRLLDSLEAQERARLERARRLAAARQAALEAARQQQASRSERRAAAPPTTTRDTATRDTGGGAATPTPPPPPPSGPVSGRAGTAVSFALAQVGKAYTYGGSGPGAYDCSGLTMAAWAAAGVSLPHTVRGQLASGRSVSISQLQPGDLVAYYNPTHHISIYIGGGRIVHAANPRSGVLTASLTSMPIYAAVRIG